MPISLYDHRMLEKEADALWSKFILRKATGGECQCCFKRRPLQAAHNIGRGRCRVTRHEPDNGLPLCAACHRRIDSDPEEKRALFLGAIGQERYERLQLMKCAGGKPDLKLVVLDLRAQLERL